MSLPDEKLKRRVSRLIEGYLSKDSASIETLIASLESKRWSLWSWRRGVHLPRRSTIKKLCALVDVDYSTFMSVDTDNIDFVSSLTLDTLVANYKYLLHKDPTNLSSLIGFCGILCVNKFKNFNLETKSIINGYTSSTPEFDTRIEIYFKHPEQYDIGIHIYGGQNTIILKCVRPNEPDEEELFCDEMSEDNLKMLINLILEKP